MFSKLTPDGRRRRILSPTTVAVSAGVHVLLLGGAMHASMGAPEPLQPDEPHVTWIEPEPEPIRPRDPEPEPLQPALPRAPVPRGEAVVMPDPPEEIPARLPEYSPSDRPIRPSEVDGIGPVGDPEGDPTVHPAPGTPTGPAGPGEAPLTIESVEERPALRNAAEVQRILQRLYPPLLRDAGITGQTELRLVVDAEGRVEPGSVEVVATTHEGFSDASLRAAEKLRFRPARVAGRGVRVMISMPITWTLERS